MLYSSVSGLCFLFTQPQYYYNLCLFLFLLVKFNNEKDNISPLTKRGGACLGRGSKFNIILYTVKSLVLIVLLHGHHLWLHTGQGGGDSEFTRAELTRIK